MNSFPGAMWSLHRHQGVEYTGEISVVGEPLISFRFRVQSGSCALGWNEVGDVMMRQKRQQQMKEA